MSQILMESQAETQVSLQPIPLLDLKAQYATIRQEIEVALGRVLLSQHFILGPEVEALEREVADYSQCQYGIGVSSGTDALLVSLMAVGVKPGDEVITSPYTFFATAGAIARLGAKPIFVDIDPRSYNIDPNLVEDAVTERTRAIIPVHLYGQMADMDPLMEVARHRRLWVIEDAAQAIGAEYKGRRAGSMGHLGCFSFFPSKNLGGFGDGGMIVTNDQELADRLQLLRNHGFRPKYVNRLIGGNFRLDALQASVLRIKLKHLDEWTEGRRRNAQSYRALFAETGLLMDSCGGAMRGERSLALPYETGQGRHVYNQFVVRSDQRDRLISVLQERRIGCEVYYPAPLHLQECFGYLGKRRGDFRVSECAALETLALPIYPELTEEQQASVVSAVVSALK